MDDEEVVKPRTRRIGLKVALVGTGLAAGVIVATPCGAGPPRAP